VLSWIGVDFTSMPGSWGGARRHPDISIDVDGMAAERPHGVLQPLKNRALKKTGERKPT
jgi:hypothetical protein